MIIIDNDIKCTKDDLLDFKKLYESISNHLSYYEEKDTLIISIEGEWGSGKTSLSNFIIEKIEEIEEKNIVSNEILHKKIFVIKFSPWMITDLNNLIKYFFSELMKTILKINKKLKKQQVIDDFKKFVQLITPDKFTIGGAEYSIDKFFNSEESIFKSKVKIANYLKDLESKILIVVDDIDRLTDSETEIFFRLIKGIADFDNLIYLLLFDKVIVSNSLKTFKNEDGEKYLDKIIQIPFYTPKLEHSKIEKVLFNRLDSIINSHSNVNFDAKRWANIYHAGLKFYFHNLRNVYRFTSSLAFQFSLFSGRKTFEVNTVDLIAIECLRIFESEAIKELSNSSKAFTTFKATSSSSTYEKENFNRQIERVIDKVSIDRKNQFKSIIIELFPTTEWILNNTYYPSEIYSRLPS